MSTNPPPPSPYAPQPEDGGEQTPFGSQQPSYQPPSGQFDDQTGQQPPQFGNPADQPPQFGGPSGQPPQFGGPSSNYPGPPRGPKSTASTVGLVLGIVGTIFAFTPVIGAIVAIPLGIAALILGILGIRKRHGAKAIVSTVLGGVAIVMSIVMFATVYPALKSAVQVGISAASAQNASIANNTSTAGASTNDDNLSDLSTDQVLKDYVNVSFGTFTASDNGFSSSLPATIKNISSKKLSIELTVAATGADGSQIDTDYTSITDLEPGQSTSKTFFSIVDPSKVQPLKAATFKVSSASIYS